MFHVIEPDLGLRNLLKSVLESKGYVVSTFGAPDAYLDYFNSPKYTAPIAILSACLMPGKNCFELAEIVRKRLPDQKLLIISSTIPQNKQAELNTHAYYSLCKPFRMGALFSLVEAFCLCEKECSYCNDSRNEDQCQYGLQDICPYFKKSAGLTDQPD